MDKAKVFLKKLSEGGALVGVIKNDSGLNEVTIGAIKNFTGITGGFTQFDGRWRPVNNYTRQWKRIANFKMLLDPQTNDHVPGNISFDTFEKIDQYKHGLGTVDEGEAIIKIDGLLHFVYYDRSAKKLCIVKI